MNVTFVDAGSEKRDAALLAGLSALAFVAARLCGVRFVEADLTDAWQLLDVERLRTDLLRSLWYLHSQPPLLNFVVGLALKSGHAPLVLTMLWSACGFLAAQSTRLLALAFGASRRLALSAGAAVAVAPSTVLYAHHVGPELATATALVASAACIARGRTRSGFALLGVACLLRSLLAPPVVLLAWLAVGRRATRPAAVVLALLLALSAKNAAIAGVFSTSSWAGLNLARVTVARVEPAVRARLSPEAQAPPFAALPPEPPTGIAVLDAPTKTGGGLNYNALAYARASSALLRDDLRAMALQPSAVVRAWATAWLTFFRPCDDWGFVAANREKLGLWSVAWDRVLSLELPLPVYVFGQTEVFLTLLLGVPLVFVLGWADRRRWYALALVASIAVIGNTFELGENNRFRLLAAPMVLALAAAEVSQRRAASRA